MSLKSLSVLQYAVTAISIKKIWALKGPGINEDTLILVHSGCWRNIIHSLNPGTTQFLKFLSEASLSKPLSFFQEVKNKYWTWVKFEIMSVIYIYLEITLEKDVFSGEKISSTNLWEKMFLTHLLPSSPVYRILSEHSGLFLAGTDCTVGIMCLCYYLPSVSLPPQVIKLHWGSMWVCDTLCLIQCIAWNKHQIPARVMNDDIDGAIAAWENAMRETCF